jgi:hypothetical protein
MKVVSYRVGPADKLSIEITDGINSLPIKGVKFQVESVIDPKDPPKGPIGPFGPFVMEFPWGGVLILSTILLMFIVGIIIKFVKIRQKKKIIERMKKYDSAQSPVAQFYAEMRKLEREIDLVFEGKIESETAVAFMKRSEDALKLFLLRQFQVPTFEWSNQMVLKDFKSRFLWFGEEIHNQLSILIRELEKSQKNDVVISSRDVHQLLKNLKRWVDRASYMADKFNLKMRET